MIIPTFYHFNLWIHLVAVSLWLGMTVHFSWFTVPMLRSLPREQASEQLKYIGVRARKVVIFLMVMLLGTGLVNLHRLGLLTDGSGWTTAFGWTVMLKVGLALALFALFPLLFAVSMRTGSPDLSTLISRLNYLHWGITGITLIIIFLGVMLRV